MFQETTRTQETKLLLFFISTIYLTLLGLQNIIKGGWYSIIRSILIITKLVSKSFKTLVCHQIYTKLGYL